MSRLGVYKTVILGDTGSGKSFLLRSIVNEPWTEGVENLETEINGKKVVLRLIEVHNDYHDHVFHQYFSDCDLSVIVFSIDDPHSLLNVESLWTLEIRRRVPYKPIVLIGNKMDLRADPETISRLWRTGNRPVSYEEGRDMATKIGASNYIECSAKHNINIHLVTEYILETVTDMTSKKYKS